MTESKLETWEEREIKERDRVAKLQEREIVLRERAMELQERQVAAMEGQTGALNKYAASPAFGDGPAERISAFFGLPSEHQDFRLREEAISLALRISTTVEQATANADLIIAYIKGD
jgi:hypothetical protein